MNRKRKIMVIVKIILILFLVYLKLISSEDTYFGGTFEEIGEILGGFRDMIVLYLGIRILSDLKYHRTDRIVFLVRLISFFLLIIFINNLYLLHSSKNFQDIYLKKQVFTHLYSVENLGLLVTMFLYKLYFLVSFNINILITGIILFFSVFIIFGKILGNGVRKIKKHYSKANRIKRKKISLLVKQEKQLKKEIVIKERQEELERNNKEKIEEENEKERREKIVEMKGNIEKKNKEELDIVEVAVVVKKESDQIIKVPNFETVEETIKEEFPKEQPNIDLESSGDIEKEEKETKEEAIKIIFEESGENNDISI